jgi:transcriptional regulator with XRE-family HTH domain
MNASARRVVDWGELLRELNRLGYSKRAIADQIELSHSAVVQYAQGINRPLHATGERLLAFYCQVTGKPRDLVPMAQELPRH